MIDEVELIEFLEEISEAYPYRIPGFPHTYSQYNEAWQDCIARVEAFIEGQTKNNGWISCDEHLPKNDEKVLVSIRYKGAIGFHDEICCGYLQEGRWYTYTLRDCDEVSQEPYHEDTVIAWHLLPEAYHGQMD